MTHAFIGASRAPAIKPSAASSACMTNLATPRYLPPPDLPDGSAWRDLFASGDIGKIASSDILVAHDYWIHRDRYLAKMLRRRLAEEIARILRWRVGRHLPEQGRDIIIDAAGVIGRAVDNPSSKRGISLRKNFWHFVLWRTLDALERSEKVHKSDTELSEESHENTTAEKNPWSVETEMVRRLDIYRLITSLPPPRNHAALLRATGETYAKIAEKLNVKSHNTIRAWLEPFEQLLG